MGCKSFAAKLQQPDVRTRPRVNNTTCVYQCSIRSISVIFRNNKNLDRTYYITWDQFDPPSSKTCLDFYCYLQFVKCRKWYHLLQAFSGNSRFWCQKPGFLIPFGLCNIAYVWRDRTLKCTNDLQGYTFVAIFC